MFTLYIVATPIGNLEDITLRALRILKEVSLIAAEDTRTTSKLLRRHNIHTPLVSYYEDNSQSRIPYILKRLEDGNVALVSDAGMPSIRDPGQNLIKAAVSAGIPIVPIPGPSALTTALAASDLSADQCLFLGFLPSRRPQRRKVLEQAAQSTHTIVLFEAPHRLRLSLDDMSNILGHNRRVTVCREMTKLHEEIYHGTLFQAAEYFKQPRGEFTIVVAGNNPTKTAFETSTKDVLMDIRALKASGIPVKEAMAWMAQRHKISRRMTYQIWLGLDSDTPDIAQLDD